MVTKTITVTEEAYEAMSRQKRSGESFSELFLRLTRTNGSLSDCLGLWEDVPEEDMDVFNEMERSWDRSEEEMTRRLKGR